MSGTEKINIDKLHKVIIEDIKSNIGDFYNRQNYYTKKYRGNRVTNVNVSIRDFTDHYEINVYLENDSKIIKHDLLVKSNKITDSSVYNKNKNE